MMTEVAPSSEGVAARELVLASAGSGKTFALSSRMIGLLAMGIPPQEILASTFTRKAAGEILDRVLLRLARGALDPKDARELADSMPAGVPAERLSPSGCEALLASVVRRLHRVQVSTLDAFFQQVGRTFALELGLPQEWSIATKPDLLRIRAAAIDAVLGELDRGAVVELVRMAGRGAAERGVHDLLMTGVTDLYEIYRMLDPGVADPWGFDGGSWEREGVDLQELERLMAALASAELPENKDGSVNKSWMGAREAALALLRAGDWEEFVKKGIAPKVLADESRFNRKDIPDEIAEIYRQLLGLARTVIGATYHRRIQALGRFLPEFDERVRELRRAEGIYDFGDVTAALAREGSLSRTAELYYRLDGKIRHILLDEFQDTSNPQWAVLEPLLDEVLSGYEGERAVFIVADPKQSIYGWRGGDPRILEGIERKYGLEPRTLSRSWRSSQVVLDAVDTIFGEVEDSPVVADYPEDVIAWKRAYASHHAAHDLPGYVRLAAGPLEDAEYDAKSTWPRLFEHVADEITVLHRAVPAASIGVLTRKNDNAVRIMNALRERGVEVSEEGGVPIVDSAAVVAVLELLRLADHPGDGVARYMVSRTPVGALVGLAADMDLDRAGAVARRVRSRLLAEGYGSVLADWERRLRPSVSHRDARRLRQLAELGFQWDGRATLRPTDFVAMVESSRAEDPAAARIRVMTVHRAKGLEFDAVFLPELDGVEFSTGEKGNGLPWREDPTGPVRRVFPPVRKDHELLFPEIHEALQQAREAEVRDTLSLLYVALTRARYAVHMHVAPNPGGASSKRSGARLVREALVGSNEAGENTVLWEDGDPRWWTDPRAPERLRTQPPSRLRRKPTTPRSTTSEEGPVLRLLPSPGRRLVPRRAPSSLEGGGRADFGLLLGAADPGARERGTLVHRWMEAIGWLEDGVPEQADLLRMARESTPGLTELESLAATFRSWLDEPDVHALLSRESYGSGATVERELPILARDGDYIIEGSIDRMVFVPGPDGPRIEVFDWKTDALDPSDASVTRARVEHYRPQLEAYVRALAANERVPEDRIRAALVFLRLGRVAWL